MIQFVTVANEVNVVETSEPQELVASQLDEVGGGMGDATLE